MYSWIFVGLLWQFECAIFVIPIELCELINWVWKKTICREGWRGEMTDGQTETEENKQWSTEMEKKKKRQLQSDDSVAWKRYWCCPDISRNYHHIIIIYYNQINIIYYLLSRFFTTISPFSLYWDVIVRTDRKWVGDTDRVGSGLQVRPGSLWAPIRHSRHVCYCQLHI